MRRAVDGALAAGVQLAAGELAATLLPGTQSPVSAFDRVVIDRLPGPAADMVVATARTADKLLLRTGLVSGFVAVGVASRRRPAVPAALGLAVGATAATRPDTRTLPTLAAGAVGGASSTAVLALLARSPGRTTRAGIALAAAAAGAAAGARRRAEHRRLLARRAALALPPPHDTPPAPPGGASFAVPGLSPLYTPAAEFYVTDVQTHVPHVDPDAWRLRVHGMVDRELSLSLAELRAMPLTELDATLVCVHNPTGGDRIGTARWAGVPLLALLDRAGMRPGAEQLLARSADGFTAGIPLSHLRAGGPALLAFGLNGEPLPLPNGFPARLIVPGLWGADANTKWVTELELTTWAAARDYWDRRGWPREPTPVKPGSRIDVPVNRAQLPPGTATVAGVAWAPPDGVERVEVSIDGEEWRPAQLADEVAPTMWRQWRADWPATPGPHELRVRAIGRSAVQDGRPAPPYPAGSSGHHAIHVSVDPGPSAPGRLRARGAAARDDVRERVRLAARALPAWRRQGYPPAPRFPAPAR